MLLSPSTALFSAGVMLSLLSYLFVHQVSAAMNHWEVSSILFNLAYFGGVSYGYYQASRGKARAVAHWLPLFFLAQALIFFTIRPFFHLVYTAAHAALGPLVRGTAPETFVATAFTWLLLFFAGTPLFAVILPKAISMNQTPLRRAYSLEIFGSVIGLLLVPLTALGGFRLLIGFYAFFAVLLALALRLPKLSTAAVAFVGGIWILFFHVFDDGVSLWLYQKKYPNLNATKMLEAQYTPYHKIEMVALGTDDRLLVLNGRRQFASGSHHVYSYFVAEIPARMLNRPKVLVLGCGSMSSVGRIGHLAESIKIVDIDPAVFETSKKYYPEYNHLNELNNWTFVADDAKHFLANDKEQYDLIIHDIPPASSRQIALTYTREFFELARKRLTTHGIFSISALRSNYRNVNYGRKILRTLSVAFPQVHALVYGDSFYTYSGFDLTGPQYRMFFEQPKRALSSEESGQWFRDEATYWPPEAIDRETQGMRPVTISHLGDLIFD